MAVQLAVFDQIRPPVGLNEAVRIVDGERSAGPGIKRSQDFDCLEQRLAAGCGLERQRDKTRQILAQRAVTRQHRIEMSSRFQPFKDAAGNGRLDQSGRVHRLSKGVDRLILVCRGQGIDAGEHLVQPVAGPPAHRLALLFDGGPGFTVHPGHEQVVHLDDLIEQGFAGFNQIASNQSRALWPGKTPEITRIIAAAEFTQLSQDLGIKIGKFTVVAEQLFNQPKSDDVALDHRRVGGFGIRFEAEQAGSCIALRHFKQQVDGRTQMLRQSAADGIE